MSDLDKQFLRHAIRVAMNGRGKVEPNPMVGCMLVKDGRVIGEGFHGIFGGPHAEPTALAACSEDPRGANAYVTLEPCCHLDKKTPPCAPKLIAAGIARVVVGCLDPNPKVNGNGVAMLRSAGIVVKGPLLEAESKQLIAPFLLRVTDHRPYVTVKWAETADGYVAGTGGKPIQITDERSTQIVHQLRSRCDAIVVGIGTVLSDDPFLTTRLTTTNIPHQRPLLRYVLDRNLRLPLDGRLVRSATEFPLIVATTNARAAKADHLRTVGATVIEAPTFDAVLADQFRRGVSHVLVEAGPTLATALFDTTLVDRLWVFRSDFSLRQQAARRAAAIPADFVETANVSLGSIRLTEYQNTKASAFFAAVPSADFLSI